MKSCFCVSVYCCVVQEKEGNVKKAKTLLDKDEIWLQRSLSTPATSYIHIPLSFWKRKGTGLNLFLCFSWNHSFSFGLSFHPSNTFLFYITLSLSFFLVVSIHSFSLLLNFISHDIAVFLSPSFPFAPSVIFVSLKDILRNEGMDDFCTAVQLKC